MRPGKQAMQTDARARTAARIGVALILAVCFAGVATPRGLRWDFANFYDAGHKARAGQLGDLYDPHARIDGQAPLGHMTFMSPPISAFLYAPLAGLRPRTALFAFKFENALVLLLSLGLLYRHGRRLVAEDAVALRRLTASFALLALLFQPLWTVFAVGGQTTPSVLLLLVCGWLAYQAAREGWSAACMVLAVCIKPVLAPGLLFLVLVSGRRFFVATAAWATAVVLVSLAVVGWDIHRAFLVHVLTRTGSPEPWVYNSSLSVWLESAARGASSPSAPLPGWIAPASLALRAAAVAVVVRCYLGVRSMVADPTARRRAGYLLAVCLVLFVSPVVWEHYLSFLFLPFGYLVAVGRGRLTTLLLVSVFILAAGQNIVFMTALRDSAVLALPGATAVAGMFKSAPLLLTASYLWFGRDEFLASFSRSHGPATATVS